MAIAKKQRTNKLTNGSMVQTWQNNVNKYIDTVIDDHQNSCFQNTKFKCILFYRGNRILKNFVDKSVF